MTATSLCRTSPANSATGVMPPSGENVAQTGKENGESDARCTPSGRSELPGRIGRQRWTPVIDTAALLLLGLGLRRGAFVLAPPRRRRDRPLAHVRSGRGSVADAGDGSRRDPKDRCRASEPPFGGHASRQQQDAQNGECGCRSAGPERISYLPPEWQRSPHVHAWTCIPSTEA